MSEPSGWPPGGLERSSIFDDLFTARLGAVAARALVAEFDRNPGPKTAIVVGADPTSAVLMAALEALEPEDRLTVVGADQDALTAHIASQGEWIERRVRMAATLAEPEPADAVIVADLLYGGTEEVRAEMERLAKAVRAGGVLSVAVPASTLLASDAAAELNRMQALHGIGRELVLRNAPPVRVHRLRFGAPDVALAARVRPLARTSSVAVTRDMHLDSNGVAAAAICLAAGLLGRRARLPRPLWLLPLLAAGPVAAFFRDPERVPPEAADAVVAASDGTVLHVERVHDERLGAEEYLRIAVFLSVLDVHVNRTPVAGAVVDQFLVEGGYAPAMKPAAEHNVAAYTVLDTARGRVAVVQRTGLIARRIVHRAPIGSLLARGERFGLIRFGSRTDVYLPAAAADPAVATGDRVIGGETVIARWR
jgi:phosphatidylserine decarboxylase